MRSASPPGTLLVTMAYQHIQVGLQDGVLTVMLDRPDVLNSFNARMADDVVAALRDARGEYRGSRRPPHR